MNYLLVMAELLGFDRPDVQRLLKDAELDPSSHSIVREALERLCKKEGIDPRNPNVWLPKATRDHLTVPDGIAIATCHLTGYEVSITIKELMCGGLLLAGQTGSGKTNAAYRIATELLNQDEHPIHS